MSRRARERRVERSSRPAVIHGERIEAARVSEPQVRRVIAAPDGLLFPGGRRAKGVSSPPAGDVTHGDRRARAEVMGPIGAAAGRVGPRDRSDASKVFVRASRALGDRAADRDDDGERQHAKVHDAFSSIRITAPAARASIVGCALGRTLTSDVPNRAPPPEEIGVCVQDTCILSLIFDPRGASIAAWVGPCSSSTVTVGCERRSVAASRAEATACDSRTTLRQRSTARAASRPISRLSIRTSPES